MASREIEARLKISAVDRASRVLRGIGNSLDDLDRRAGAMGRMSSAMAAHNTRMAEQNRMLLIGGGAAVAIGTAMAARAVAASITDYAALERQITRIGITADASSDQVKSVSQAILEISQDAAMPLGDVYAGFEGLIAAGRSWEESLSFLPSIVKTAQAAGASTMDIANTADSLATSMKITGDEMEAAFDKLVMGGKLGKFELRDMASYLPSLLPQMAALGYSGLDGLEQTVAMLQTMRLQTGTAGEAATNLTNVLGKMLSPDTISKFEKQFNINLPKALEEATENGEDLLEAFVRISREATKGDMEQMGRVFADQQFRAGMLALMQGADAWEDFQAGVRNSSGAVNDGLRRVLGDTQADIDRLGNSWSSFTTSVGKFAVAAGADSALAQAAERIENAAEFLSQAAENGIVKATGDLFEDDALKRYYETARGKAFIDAYREQSKGAMPTADQVTAAVGSGVDMLDPGVDGAAIKAAAKAGALEAMTYSYPDEASRAKAGGRVQALALDRLPVRTTQEPAPQFMAPMPVLAPNVASLYPMPAERFYPTSQPLDARADRLPSGGPNMLTVMAAPAERPEQSAAFFDALVGPMKEAVEALRETARSDLPRAKPEYEPPLPSSRPVSDIMTDLAEMSYVAGDQVSAVNDVMAGIDLANPARAAVSALNGEFAAGVNSFVGTVLTAAARLRSAAAASAAAAAPVRVNTGESMPNN